MKAIIDGECQICGEFINAYSVNAGLEHMVNCISDRTDEIRLLINHDTCRVCEADVQYMPPADKWEHMLNCMQAEIL